MKPALRNIQNLSEWTARMFVGMGGDEIELSIAVFAARCAKKMDAWRITSFSCFNCLASWRSGASANASAFV
jgi:hypothetical protein